METWQVLLKNADSEIEALKDGRAELRATIDNLHTTIESQAEETAQVVAENDTLRARVTELEKRIAAAQGIIDTNADALTGWRARGFAEAMRSALKGGE